MTHQNEIAWTPQQISRFWDYQSTRPSAKENYFSATRSPHIIKRTMKAIAEVKEPRVLDMGCGVGDFLKAFSRMRTSALLYGVDFSTDTIHTAQQNCTSINPPPELHAIERYPTPWSDGTFDAIYSIEVIEHLPDKALDLMFREANRILKTGGFFFITTPNSEDLERSHTCCPNCGTIFHIWQHVRSWTAQSLAEFADGYGFSRVLVKATLLDAMYLRTLVWVARKLGLSQKQAPHILAIFRKREGGESVEAVGSGNEKSI